MGKTLTVKTLVIAIVTLIGCTNAYAQDLNNEETAYESTAYDVENTSAFVNEDNGPGMGVACLIGVATVVPYLTESAVLVVNTTIGLVADIFIPDNAEEPQTKPSVMIAADEKK